MRNIAVIGTGYVGLVAGAGLAELGHNVICVDNRPEIIDKLNNNQIPIYEPGLEDLVARNREAQRIAFTTNIQEAITQAEIIFIAVGTPPKSDGSVDMQYVDAVADDIGLHLNNYKVIVDKSTVPVGTADYVTGRILQILKERKQKGCEWLQNEKDLCALFDVTSNPEFLREGCAVGDFLEGDRVVVGANSPQAAEIMKDVYANLDSEYIQTDVHSAELIKYASNAFLAVKISFINEISRLCELVGADVEKVALGMGSDTRIGNKFLKAGAGYGGSCFPKDTSALVDIAQKQGYDFKIVKSAIEVNNNQRAFVFEKLKQMLNGQLKNKKIGFWGLAFKPNTDDMRFAPSIELAQWLNENGASVQAYDPVAMHEAREILPFVHMVQSPLEAAKDVDLLLLITEWQEFKDVNLSETLNVMAQNHFLDARNVFSANTMQQIGFHYQSIGREC